MKNIKYNIFLVIAFFTIIGTIGFAINTLFSTNEDQIFSYISKDLYWININSGISIYKFDINKYIKNVEMTLTSLKAFNFKLPQMYEINNINDSIRLLANIGNVLISIFNITLYPLQIGGYVLINILGILGINTGLDINNPVPESALKWLIDMANYLVNSSIIPYISL